MSLAEDERWRAVPPSQVLPWLLTIRNTDGSFRTPTKDEVDHLIACYPRAAELEAALEDALGIIRLLMTMCNLDDDDIPARVHKLSELIK